ncbi:hypothetical protein PIB30_029004 [Stylosanthes scabra]|uniref:Uncharacterized protein n=1 Tax=Stylosanthes scabra TaxID=79078 RepID=A0ABU6XB91_9FABA|nr:hypothetical protein [Stylosanthes scabra]
MPSHVFGQLTHFRPSIVDMKPFLHYPRLDGPRFSFSILLGPISLWSNSFNHKHICLWTTKNGGPAPASLPQTEPSDNGSTSVVVPSAMLDAKVMSISPPARKRQRPQSLKNSPILVMPDNTVQVTESSVTAVQQSEETTSPSNSVPLS